MTDKIETGRLSPLCTMATLASKGGAGVIVGEGTTGNPHTGDGGNADEVASLGFDSTGEGDERSTRGCEMLGFRRENILWQHVDLSARRRRIGGQASPRKVGVGEEARCPWGRHAEGKQAQPVAVVACRTETEAPPDPST